MRPLWGRKPYVGHQRLVICDPAGVINLVLISGFLGAVVINKFHTFLIPS